MVKMVFFRIFEIINFCSICDLLHDMETILYTAFGFFFHFHGRHSYFSKDFQMLCSS